MPHATMSGRCRAFIGRRRTALVAIVAAGFVATVGPQTHAADFVREVAPILVARCLECHGGEQPAGGLRLLDEPGLRAGGDSGAVVVAGRAAESPLWQRVAADEMPPKHPLPAEEKAVLSRWIDAGAAWAGGPLDPFATSTPSRAGRDWWSLQPLREVVPPDDGVARPSAGNDTGPRPLHPIDAFVGRRLAEAGLRPAAAADPRTLLRRLSFDLVGLPPTPAALDAFAADPSEAAYLRIVDGLLASPAYGERWARHWLDVVRFGESDGFERNFVREHAWHYRDWVIRALAADMPYDEFVRMQLLGDRLVGGVEGAAATGFWVAGVHNTVVGGSERMKLLARQDELEEVLATLGQTFVGLTFHCARCHDHKFDPVSQREYYQLAAAISGLGFGDRDVPVPVEQDRLAAIDERLTAARRDLATLDATARRRVIAARDATPAAGPEPPPPLARWEFDGDLRDAVGDLHGTAVGAARTEDGALVLDGASFVTTPPLERDIAAKTLEAWVQLDDLAQRGGGVLSIETPDGVVFDALVFGEREPGRWLAGSNNFQRSGSFAGSDEVEAEGRPVHVAVVYRADGTIECYRDGLPYGQPTRVAPLQPFAAGRAEIVFGLRHRPPGGNRHLRGKIHRAAFHDRALSAAEVAASAAAAGVVVSSEELAAVLAPEERSRRDGLAALVASLTEARTEQAARARVRVHTLAPGPGAVTRLLGRGDPDLAGDVVPPGATAAIPGLPADFALPPDAPEAERRRRLADWITHADNPLFLRVAVNRVWHHHFGAGIVDTPSDFGFNGGRPSHPELLEWLAGEFRRHGQRLSWLHRLIVTSHAYRQASRPRDADPRGPAVDAENRLLWRGPSRRLEAEALRDAMLAVSGALEAGGGGPGFRDVSVTLNNGTTYYEPIDADGAGVLRRTIYRFSPRGSRSPLLETFDCPDPSATAPRRTVTTTPLQSLALFNDAFVLRMAEAFAGRVVGEVGADVPRQVTRAWWLALGRAPDGDERQLAERLVTDHGLPALCRGLFNVSEFVVID
jgi:hypothetical protein